MVDIQRPLHTTQLHTTKYQFSNHGNPNFLSFLEQHSSGFHRLSSAASYDCICLKVQNRLVWGYTFNPKGGSQVSDRGEQSLESEYIIWLRAVVTETWMLKTLVIFIGRRYDQIAILLARIRKLDRCVYCPRLSRAIVRCEDVWLFWVFLSIG